MILTCPSTRLPATLAFEELQERPYKPIRSHTGHIRHFGPPLQLRLRATDVVHLEVEEVASNDFAHLLGRLNSPSTLRTAQSKEFAGQGYCEDDFMPTFMWQMLPQPVKTVIDTGSSSPVSRRAKKAEDAVKLLEQRRVEMKGVDPFLDEEREEDEDKVRATLDGPKWVRSLFIVSKIPDTSAQPIGIQHSPSTESLCSLTSDGEYDNDDANAHKRVLQRADTRRHELGLHYLDNNGEPKLLFPLNGEIVAWPRQGRKSKRRRTRCTTACCNIE
jgi:hypothetical protein